MNLLKPLVRDLLIGTAITALIIATGHLVSYLLGLR
jgi:hypothetical protein